MSVRGDDPCAAAARRQLTESPEALHAVEPRGPAKAGQKKRAMREHGEKNPMSHVSVVV